MISYLHSHLVPYLYGLGTLPALILGFWALMRFLAWFRRWLLGLGCVSWFGMLLVCLGLGLVRKKHLALSTRGDRHWVSPNVAAFRDTPTDQ